MPIPWQSAYTISIGVDRAFILRPDTLGHLIRPLQTLYLHSIHITIHIFDRAKSKRQSFLAILMQGFVYSQSKCLSWLQEAWRLRLFITDICLRMEMTQFFNLSLTFPPSRRNGFSFIVALIMLFLSPRIHFHRKVFYILVPKNYFPLPFMWFLFNLIYLCSCAAPLQHLYFDTNCVKNVF